jgi:transposase
MSGGEESIEDLIKRRSAPVSDPDRELALLARLPAKKQQLVAERLVKLDKFMSAQERGSADVEAAAKDLGVTVRSLYRLVRRVRDMGPVAALAPTPGAGRKRRSDADGALSMEVKAEIYRQVTTFPHQPMSAIVSRIREIDSDVSPSTVRRQAMVFRRNSDPTEDVELGRRWLLDQAAVRIPVLRGGETYWLVATFLVDIDTGVIAGRWVTKEVNETGIGALLHFVGRAKALFRTTLRFAPRVEEITWVVPDGMHIAGDRIAERAAALSPPVNVTIIGGDKFRRGKELSKLMGGVIGLTDVLIRATPDPRMTITENDPPALGEEQALTWLDQDISFEHRLLAKWAIPDKDVVPSKARVSTLKRITRQLVDVFEPVLSPEQLQEARNSIDGIAAASSGARDAG